MKGVVGKGLVGVVVVLVFTVGDGGVSWLHWLNMIGLRISIIVDIVVVTVDGIVDIDTVPASMFIASVAVLHNSINSFAVRIDFNVDRILVNTVIDHERIVAEGIFHGCIVIDCIFLTYNDLNHIDLTDSIVLAHMVVVAQSKVFIDIVLVVAAITVAHILPRHFVIITDEFQIPHRYTYYRLVIILIRS